MARGLKIHKYDALGANGITQKDQAIGPQTVTFLSATGTNTTSYLGGVAGQTANTAQLTILVNYKTAAGSAKTDGQILQQRGRKQFNVQSAATGAASLTRATLVGGSSQPTLSASQMYIKCCDPTGVVFYATRISNRFVWNGDTRYSYTLATSTQLTFVDTYNAGTKLNDGITGLALVEGA
jgi:hypothetical protein